MNIRILYNKCHDNRDNEEEYDGDEEKKQNRCVYVILKLLYCSHIFKKN